MGVMERVLQARGSRGRWRRPPLVPLASLVSVVNDLQGQRLQGTSFCRAHGRGRERGQLAHSLVSLSLFLYLAVADLYA